MLVQLGDAKAVDAKSANGTASFTCHGRNVVGGLISGTDVVTGVPVEGTLSTTRDACAALEGFGLGHACRGNNKGGIILNAEFRGEPCLFGERSTLDWNSVRAPSGEVMLSCHFSE
jgi:hypothetical protein